MRARATRTTTILGLLVAAVAAAAAPAATRSGPPPGQYFFSHAAGHDEFTGGFVLHGAHAVTTIGITTDLVACTRPPSTKVQFPGPPDNWQPQKTIPVHRSGANLVFSFSGSFRNRLSSYPQTMQITATITPTGHVTGHASLTSDDTASASGELKCRTRSAIPFTGKHA